jgi:hypothetical protein
VTTLLSGAAVKLAEDKGCALSDLTVEDLKVGLYESTHGSKAPGFNACT